MKRIILLVCVVLILLMFTGCKKGSYALIKTNQGDILVQLTPETTPETVANFIGLAEGTKEWTDPKSGQKVKKPFYDGLIFHRVINDFMIQGGCPLGTGTSGPGYKFEDECYEPGEEITGAIDSEEKARTVFSQVLVPYMQANQANPDPEIKDIIMKTSQAQSGKFIMEKSVEYFKEKTGYTGSVSGQGKLIAKVDYGTLCMANSGPNTNGSQFFIVTKKAGCSWLNGKHTVFGRVIKGMDVAHKIEALEKDKNDKPLESNQAIIEKIVIKKYI